LYYEKRENKWKRGREWPIVGVYVVCCKLY